MDKLSKFIVSDLSLTLTLIVLFAFFFYVRVLSSFHPVGSRQISSDLVRFCTILFICCFQIRCILCGAMAKSCNSLNSHTLGCQIDEYTRLFGTKETWRRKQTQRQTKVFNKNPPYSFIWPYSFNWHLGVLLIKV